MEQHELTGGTEGRVRRRAVQFGWTFGCMKGVTAIVSIMVDIHSCFLAPGPAISFMSTLGDIHLDHTGMV